MAFTDVLIKVGQFATEVADAIESEKKAHESSKPKPAPTDKGKVTLSQKIVDELNDEILALRGRLSKVQQQNRLLNEQKIALTAERDQLKSTVEAAQAQQNSGQALDTETFDTAWERLNRRPLPKTQQAFGKRLSDFAKLTGLDTNAGRLK
jgi:predicted RNase H-like nuclease (RuvC/YqgF family)